MHPRKLQRCQGTCRPSCLLPKDLSQDATAERVTLKWFPQLFFSLVAWIQSVLSFDPIHQLSFWLKESNWHPACL